MDADSPAKWDFLAPWCELLRGQLLSLPNGFTRVLVGRRREDTPIRFDLKEEEEEKADPEKQKQEMEDTVWRTREAIQLLSLVAKNYDAGEEDGDFFLTDDDDSESDDDEEADEENSGGEQEQEEEERSNGENVTNNDEYNDNQQHRDIVAATASGNDRSGDSDAGAAGAEDEQEDDRTGDGDVENNEDGSDEEDDVLVLPADTTKSDRRRERQNFLSPQFDFISLRGIGGADDIFDSPISPWQKLFLAEAPQFQPNEAYTNAKARILEMLPRDNKLRRRMQRSFEIPISLEFKNWAETAEELAGYLKDLGIFIEAIKHRAQKLDADSLRAENNPHDCASIFTYRLAKLSMTLHHRDERSDLFVQRLLKVLGIGIHFAEFHMYIDKRNSTFGDETTSREVLVKLLSGMLIRPLSPTQKEMPAFTTLNIGCSDAIMWQVEALCLALSASRASIKKLHLDDMCSYRTKDEVRAYYWKLVAQAFFCTRSCKNVPTSSVRGLDLSDAKLTMDDLAAISDVLQEKEHQEKVAQQWDLCKKSWLLRGNTQVHFITIQGNKRVLVSGRPVTLPCDTPAHLVHSSGDENTDDDSWLDVIIPAYGQCRAPRASVVATSSKDTEKPKREPLESLTLSSKTNADGVPGLVKHIGWSLSELSLSFHREVDVNAMVPTILNSCPKLMKLSLCESYIDLDLFSTTYEECGENGASAPVIRKLQFHDLYGIGEGEGLLFMKRLGDLTTRLAKDVRELSILTEEYAEPLEHPTLSELWMAMGKNSTLEKLEIMVSRSMWSAIWKRRLRKFDGQVLPSRPLPLECKLAFLSVTHPVLDSKDSLPTSAQRLDQRVLSLIFEFASTRVVRSVKVWG
ncbi:unnamed protein product [Phytophthora lilii]|uniref:Unnamed protein product n=1 Tax=Phytophthora lilii TaxID=2077276 RepID=A0A9W6WTV4_9STRA|nr:unnamed protein product [Phytophthora lilii]